MIAKTKYAFVMMCLILSYGLCAFAGQDTDTNSSPKEIEKSIDIAAVSELMSEDNDPAYQDFEPDYVFSESDEALLNRDIGNY